MKKTILLFISFLWTLLTAGCSSSSSATFISEENHVSTEKHTQSMSIEATSPSILPQTTTVGLIIHQAPSKYTYEDLVHDMNQLTSNYGDIVHVQSLCDTADGRRVYDVVLGNPQGKNQILIFGAMHAREYITTQIVMRQLCDAIDAINGYGGEYRGISLHKLLNDMTIHFVPMNNPDGVAMKLSI